jgi:hypothetical protein
MGRCHGVTTIEFNEFFLTTKAIILNEMSKAAIKHCVMNCVIKTVEWINPSKLNLRSENSNNPFKFSSFVREFAISKEPNAAKW